MTVTRFRLPSALGIPAAVAVYGTVNVGAPISVGTLGAHAGWHNHTPGALNLIGLVPIVLGGALILWAGVSHATMQRALGWRVLKIDADHLFTPDYLVTEGPYRYSRNPLYVADLTMWAGWAIVLGSLPVLIGLCALTVGFQGAVRLEERGLRRQFRSEWQRYAARTPRFLPTSIKR